MSQVGNGSGLSLAGPLGGASGEAAGGQAQGGILLQLLTRIVLALENGGAGGASTLYNTYAWTGGSLDIATAFPAAKSGTFILTGVSTVTLPGTGGPWIIADGSGFCAPTAQITVQATGDTVQQVASYFMVQAFQANTFIKDGASANYIVL